MELHGLPSSCWVSCRGGIGVIGLMLVSMAWERLRRADLSALGGISLDRLAGCLGVVYVAFSVISADSWAFVLYSFGVRVHGIQCVWDLVVHRPLCLIRVSSY